MLNDLFKLDENTGILKATSARSQYIANGAYKLTVRAVSRLDEKNLNTTLDLTIKVDSTVDSLFDSRIYNIDIEENAAVGDYVFTLHPHPNKDTNKKLKFKFNTQNSLPTQLYNVWFQLDESTGLIRTKSSAIDYETCNETLLSIDVFDARTNDLIENVLVRVNILDLNDNYPIYDKSYNYEPKIAEDDSSTIQKERFITKFKATDLDGTFFNSKLEYLIAEDDFFAKSFKLVQLDNQEIGLFKVNGIELDRDDTKRVKNNKIKLKIIVHDMAISEMDRLSQEIQIVITLLDLNDNYPSVTSSQSVMELREDFEVNKPFLRIEAEDLDEGNKFINKFIILP